MKKLSILVIGLFIVINLFSQNINFRDSINVVLYQINLEIGDNTNKQIKGNTKLTLFPLFDNTKTIKLDLLKLTVDSIFIENEKISKWKHDKKIININLTKTANKNDQLVITVYYHGKPTKDKRWGGFQFSERDVFNIGVGMTDYPHAYGRVWFPCIDHFTDKATYDYNITVNNNRTAVCSGLLVEEIEVKKHTKTFHWRIKDEIPTYLSSMAVSHYELLSSTYKGIEREIPVNIYVFKNKKEKAEKSFVNLHSAIKVFEEKFGAYAWERVGYVETSFSSGAMEHATNIAYPSYAVNGTLKNQNLYVHELSHNWFGNLVTCKTSQDMWINEGWASYCEAIFIQEFYGTKKFKSYVRDNHIKVLTRTHLWDGDYLAVAGVSPENTYGSTVYDKGSSVVHALRGYMGDSLFYNSAKNYFKEFAFGNASSEDMKNSFSKSSGIDLTDFFEFWIYSKGFTFFEIINQNIKEKNGKYLVEIQVKQRLVAANKFANSNRIEIFFMNEDLKTEKRIFEFSGELGKNSFELPFKPVLIMLDLNEKITDATIDNAHEITDSRGNFVFEATQVELKVLKNKKIAFVRVQSCWIEPENNKTKKYTVASHYWKVESFAQDEFKAELNFYYKDNYYTDKFVQNKKDIVLLYRPDSKSKWKEIKCENNKIENCYVCNTFKAGEYVFAKVK